MKVAYYPGCSAEGTGQELDQSTRDLCRMLDMELTELPDWSCCGASSAHTVSHELNVALAGRNLAIAEQMGDEVVTPCPACFGRLAAARHHVLEHGAPKGVENVTGKAEVKHVMHLFSKEEVLKKLKKQAGDGLKGLKVVCYYGCLTSRPANITGAPKPENPTEVDDILKALGAEVIDWSYKTTCCGGSLTMTRDEIVGKLTGDIFKMAARTGAEAIVTGCSMCFMNLERQWMGDGPRPLPVFYFTELMMLALDPTRAKGYFRKHLSDPQSLLSIRELA